MTSPKKRSFRSLNANFRAKFSSSFNLEPRLMLAADTGAALSADVAQASPAPPSTVVFVDAAVSKSEVLLADLPASADIVSLSAELDPIDQITAALKNRSGIQSLHIISHGDEGQLMLGDEAVNIQTLQARKEAIGEWSNALSEDADILIYGCNVASGSAGEAFLQELAFATGADIAASNDLTGNKSAADWVLEKTIGEVQTPVILSATARNEYDQTLHIQIFAAGATGTERMELQIDGQTVASWSNIGGDFEDRWFQQFTYDGQTNVSGDRVRVVFTNDQYIEGVTDRNLHVDRIVINGREIQTESEFVFSNGTWRPGIGFQPGNVQLESLHKNGYFQFNEQSTNHLIEIHAAGATGTETMQLLIDGEVVNEWQGVQGNLYTRQFESFYYNPGESVAPNRIRVQFANDGAENGIDRNLVVDDIFVDGVQYEAEAHNVISTGTWRAEDGVVTGFRQSEWLHTNGFFQFEADVRTIDGSGNNIDNPEWGATDAELLRIADPQYADGVSSPAGQYRPGPREISNLIADQVDGAVGNSRALSAMLHVWGQFIDHDLDLTEPPKYGGEDSPIAIPFGDAFFDPFYSGETFIPFTRSEWIEGTGTDASNPRQHANQLSAFLDGSMVYASDAETASSLREYSGGRMQMSEGNLLPKDDNDFYLAGDIRAMENVNLTSMHTLFAREHNYWANQIQQEFPSLSDEQIYQEARKIVIAEIQAITFNEFLPALLGDYALGDYSGYDATVNPGIATEFSTAAFRFGHTMLNDDVRFLKDDGNLQGPSISLADAFFDPTHIQTYGIDSSLKFLMSTQAQEIDNQIVDGLRNFLFGPPGAGGLDLASLNIARGRDHGIADYNSTREAYGLERVHDFSDITSNFDLQNKLRDAYGNVDNIDLWVGGLAEDHAYDSSIGETFRTIIVDQFWRIRAGDRLWYQNSFSQDAVNAIDQTSLSDIIRRNTDLNTVQDDTFKMWGTIDGALYAGDDSFGFPLVGVQLKLYDGEGNFRAATYSDANGRYHFNQITEVGAYRVVMLLGHPYGTTGETYQDVWFNVGNKSFDGIDFLIPDAYQFV